MAVKINKRGEVVVTMPKGGLDAIEELKMRREAIFEAINELGKDSIPPNSDTFYGLVELLKDTEPSHEQYSKMFN